jgi:hypothetical protein
MKRHRHRGAGVLPVKVEAASSRFDGEAAGSQSRRDARHMAVGEQSEPTENLFKTASPAGTIAARFANSNASAGANAGAPAQSAAAPCVACHLFPPSVGSALRAPTTANRCRPFEAKTAAGAAISKKQPRRPAPVFRAGNISAAKLQPQPASHPSPP